MVLAALTAWRSLHFSSRYGAKRVTGSFVIAGKARLTLRSQCCPSLALLRCEMGGCGTQRSPDCSATFWGHFIEIRGHFNNSLFPPCESTFPQGSRIVSPLDSKV